MLQMLTGLLDYGEVQDGRFQLAERALPRRGARRRACATRCAPRAPGGAAVAVLPGTPERVYGDLDRLRQVFVHLALYMLEGRDPAADADHASATTARNLVGEIAVRRRTAR